MINLSKTHPEPADLAPERAKSSGTYRTDGVIEQLVKDFHNKCYLCGQKAPTGINVEHFEEHQGDRILEMRWENLYFACTHCNSCKNGHGAILNCLSPDHRLAEWIEYGYQPFPVGLPAFGMRSEIDAVYHSLTENTLRLLLKIFSASAPPIRKLEASNLSKALETDLLAFDRILTDLETWSVASRIARLEELLAPDTPFTAFRYWHLRREFPEWLEGVTLHPHLAEATPAGN